MKSELEKQATLIRSDEAKKYIDAVADPVTRNLLNLAFVHVVRTCCLEKSTAPRRDFDMEFFVKVLEPFFTEHEVLARTLAGEKVGAWFEDEA